MCRNRTMTITSSDAMQRRRGCSSRRRRAPTRHSQARAGSRKRLQDIQWQAHSVRWATHGTHALLPSSHTLANQLLRCISSSMANTHPARIQYGTNAAPRITDAPSARDRSGTIIGTMNARPAWAQSSERDALLDQHVIVGANQSIQKGGVAWGCMNEGYYYQLY